MENTLDRFIFKNRPWLFLLFLPIPFILFFFNYLVYFLIFQEKYRTIFTFIIPLVFLYFEMFVASHFVSKLRYINIGDIGFDYKGIFIKNRLNVKIIHWDNISRIDVIYSGDRFWKSKYSFFQKQKVYRRYHSTHWFGLNKLDDKILDKIEVNGEKYYVKIKSEKDKNLLFGFLDKAKEHGIKGSIIEPDLTVRLFGRTIKA